MKWLKTAPGLRIALAAAMSITTAMASAPEHRWGIGPLAGINVSNADLGGPEDQGIAGWALGGRLEMGVNRILSLATDPMFIRHGAEWDPNGDPFEARGQFYRIEVPMFLKAQTTLLNVGVYAFAGPNAQFLWDASGQVDDGQNLGGDASEYGFSGDVGVGSAFSVAPLVDITADARYSHGFTDMLEHGSGDVDHWRSRDVRLVLGVILYEGG